MVPVAPTVAALVLSLGAFAGEQDASDLALTAPTPRRLPPIRIGHAFPKEDAEAYLRVQADLLTVYRRARRRGWGLGTLERGAIVAGEPRYGNADCRVGWVRLTTGGYVCPSDGAEALDGPDAEPMRVLAADPASPLPFRYVKLAADAPILAALPASGETIEEAPVVAHVEGVVFRAVDRPVDDGPAPMLRLVDGTYVPQSAVTRRVEPPTATGQPIVKASLPIAFVIAADAPVYTLEDGRAQSIGHAERYARFAVAEETEHQGTRYVVAEGGEALARDDVRVAVTIDRPRHVDADDRWMHVDLDEQVLVAYEGDKPVYVTLVASGKDGFDTPEGLYRIRRKYVSRTMQGPDPEAGSYDIGDVPWTMYYHGGLAIHGAYWHDDFGNVRSHGCTNLPPESARWLFSWSTPNVPEGWVGIHDAGTRIYFTRD